MASIDLRVRDLQSGVVSVKAFDGAAAAEAWLAERPRFTEVLGVATAGLDAAVNARLKAAMRPLDAEEKALEAKLEAESAAAAAERQAAQRAKEQAAAAAHRTAMASADPNRVMEVHWRYDREMELTDPSDARPIPDEARAAVLAWVRERDEWVAGRGQVVGDAKVTVWPGPLPASAGGERVKGGTFIPVTAPAKA